MPILKKLPENSDPVSDASGLMGPIGAGGQVVGGLISLLTKEQRLQAMARHLEKLKGTVYEKASQRAADRWPRVFGHIGHIDPDAGLKGGLGEFSTDRAHDAALGGFKK